MKIYVKSSVNHNYHGYDYVTNENGSYFYDPQIGDYCNFPTEKELEDYIDDMLDTNCINDETEEYVRYGRNDKWLSKHYIYNIFKNECYSSDYKCIIQDCLKSIRRYNGDIDEDDMGCIESYLDRMKNSITEYEYYDVKARQKDDFSQFIH